MKKGVISISLVLIITLNNKITYAKRPYLPLKPISIGPVRIANRSLQIDPDGDGVYEPFLIKGVNYQPIPIGRYPGDWGENIYASEEILLRDFSLLAQMHANTVRVWKGNYIPETPGDTLQLTDLFFYLAQEYGLFVCAGFWIRYDLDISDPAVREEILSSFASFVTQFKDYPSLLIWVIGNENNLYYQDNLEDWYSLVNEMAYLAYQIEGPTYHPVAVVNREIEEIGNSDLGASDEQLPYLDIWGVNVYRGYSFGNLFEDFSSRTQKPLWISEYGIDAWYNLAFDWALTSSLGYEDEKSQAIWIGHLWDEISDHTNVCIGATVMEYSDEWWKSPHADPWLHAKIHDYGGYWMPGASPDDFFNEEWWGIVSIEKNGSQPDIVHPREAYYILKNKYSSLKITASKKHTFK